MRALRLSCLVVAATLALLAASCGGPREPIRIAFFGHCEGEATGFYDVSLAGAELALLRRGGKLSGTKPSDGVEGVTIGGRNVELIFGCAGEPISGAVELRRLVENEGADIVVGPNYPTVGVTTVQYAKHQPDVTFAITSWEVLTGLDPGPNVFRFTLGYAQGLAGLGAYAYHKRGWRRAITIAYPDTLGWGWSAGVVAEFCSLGGDIVDREWLFDAPDKLSKHLAQIPTKGVDGYFLLTNGPEAGAFLEQLAKTEPYPGQKVISSAAAATGLDPTVISRLGKRLVGITLAWDIGPLGTYPAEYRRAFPELADAADANFHLWDVYFNTGMEAVLRALETVDGDLSDGQRRFRSALAKVEFDAPNGHVRLDANRQAVGPTYMFQIDGYARGAPAPHYRVLKEVKNVDASFGGHFGTDDPLPDRTQPRCEHGNPPAWARR